MKKHGAIIRLVICYVLCVSLIVCSSSSIILKLKPPFTDIFSYNGYFDNNFVFQNDQITPENTSSPTENTQKEQISTNEGVTSSKPVQSAAVKGKVIEKYISPYTAKLSYNKIYMKNSTSLSINIKNLFNSKLSFKIEKNNKPQVLIVHTHTTETFLETDAKT